MEMKNLQEAWKLKDHLDSRFLKQRKNRKRKFDHRLDTRA